MNKYSLFYGMNENEINNILKYLDTDEREYKKSSTVMYFNQMSENIGIMQKGTAYLIVSNTDGEKSIIDYYQEGDVFGRQFSPNISVNLYCIVAKTKCSVKFCRYDKMLNYLNNNGQNYRKFINNLICNSSRKAQIHIDILSQRTIRNKLMTYFRYISFQSDSKQIKLPLPLTDLADYLLIDRCAMMRELKKMNEAGMIISKGHNITIL